jgi:hypothetical protein
MSAPAQSQQAEPARTGQGWYVYGIVPGDVEPTGEAAGVGDPPGSVEVVPHGGIAALVSEIDVSKPLGKPEDILAHQQLLDATVAEAPVLPMRFGAVLSSKDAVVDELLSPYEEEFATALRELEGRAEFVIKGRYVQDAVLREVLSENTEAAQVRDEIRQTGDEDASRNARIRLGEIISSAIEAKREVDTHALGDAVAACSLSSNVRPPSHEEDAVHVALLVDMAKRDDLEQAVGKIAQDWKGRVNLRLLGPMAAYDFVVAQRPEG